MASPDLTRFTDRLVGSLEPVGKLWSPAARTALWVALEATVLLYLVTSGVRADVASRLSMPGFVLELAAIVSAAIVLARLAFGAGVPGDEVPSAVRWVALGCVALAIGHVATLPFRVDVTLEAFVSAGRSCAVHTVGMAAGPWVVVLIALRRAAPFRCAIAGALAAGAAFLMAFAFMRLVCPADDMLHLIAWHGTPVIAAALVSTAVGAWWLPRWRR